MFNLYFDESGNTGANYLDDKQRYFVYGGWLISEEKESIIEQKILELFKLSKARELKSVNGIKQYKLNELFKMMYDNGAIPIFGVADKRYMIAAKIVETFFDHMYNPNVNGYLTFKSDLKKALADSIFDNKELLNEFALLIKNGTIPIETMTRIKNMLVKHFVDLKLQIVSDSLENLNEKNLHEMIGEFEYVSHAGEKKRWLSLVHPVLFDRILAVDRISEITRNDTKLYVDELQGYNDIFFELAEIFCKKTIIKNVSYEGQLKSHENVFIQIADLLCGFVYKSVSTKNESSNIEIVQELWQDLWFFRECYREHQIICWDFFGHNSFEYELLRLAGYSGATNIIDCNEVIRSRYKKALLK